MLMIDIFYFCMIHYIGFYRLKISVITKNWNNDTYFDQGYAKGYAKATDAVDIKYVYHTHTGNSSEMGGCYTIGYHTHTSACTSTCTYTAKCVDASQGESGMWHNEYVYNHQNCGQGTVTGSDWQNHSRKGQTWTGTHTYSSCNNIINAYKLGCGKTEATIESATISFK